MTTETTTRFFDLQPTHNSHRWTLPVHEGVAVGPPGKKFLFGGVGLGSAMEAVERTTGRPTIWATAQYLSYAQPGSIVDIDVIVPKSGKNVTQARVVGHIEDREIFTVNVAVGARDKPETGAWVTLPDVPDPDDCAEKWQYDPKASDLHSRLDTRVAMGRYGPARKTGGPSTDGRAVLWGRPLTGEPFTASMLAIFADFVPSAAGHALGREAGANSLDNTIRIHRLVETEWVCCAIQIDAIHAGFVHGHMHIFAQDGTLMATASQSGILRFWDE